MRSFLYTSFLVLAATSAHADPEAARALYMRGALPDGHVIQRCASCHAIDGGGGRASGVESPAISASASGDARGTAYDAAALRTLLADGRTPEGRTISSVMPRIEIEPALAEELRILLPKLGALDAAGVTDDRIRIGVLSAGDGDSFPAALMRAVEKWSEGGLVHGRRVALEPLGPDALRRDAPNLFAIVGVTAPHGALGADIAAAGGLDLFPRHSFNGDEDADRNRGLLPDQTILARALLAATANCGGIAFDDRDMEAAPAVAEIFRRDVETDEKSTRLCRVALVDRGAIADEERLIAPFEAFAGRAAELARHKGGATLIDTRQSRGDARADAERFAETAGLVLVRGLTAAGRKLTRSRFMLALDGLSLAPEGWNAIDYRANRLSGTTAVRTVELDPRP